MHHARWLKHGDVQADRPCRDDRRDDGWLWCSQCRSHWPPAEFHRNRATKTGYDGVCRECVLARRATQKVHIAIVTKAYRERNAERVRERKRREYARNRERSLQKGSEWRAANPERLRLQIRAQNAARYARLKAAPGKATVEQIAARWLYYGGRCWICGAKATDTDHVKPLARGGSNWPANLRPACSPCNRRKWSVWPLGGADESRCRPPSQVTPVDRRNNQLHGRLNILSGAVSAGKTIRS